jgi:hypothetical protein
LQTPPFVPQEVCRCSGGGTPTPFPTFINLPLLRTSSNLAESSPSTADNH